MLSELIDFLGSLHPLIVHLPIGIVCLTIAIDVFMKNKNNSVLRVITMGWFLSFFSGLLAAVFGWFLGDNGYYFESQINIHRWSGIAFGPMLYCMANAFPQLSLLALFKAYYQHDHNHSAYCNRTFWRGNDSRSKLSF